MKPDHELDQITSNWKKINTNLTDLTEDEIKRALERRITLNPSKTVIVRLHQRYCALRATREREELLAHLAQDDSTQDDHLPESEPQETSLPEDMPQDDSIPDFLRGIGQ